MPAARELDIVLFGATGFTGGLTADYLATHAPPGLRWALAGRNADKLETVRDRLASLDERWDELPLLHADVTDPDTLAAVAERARVVITTVGPYLEYGEPLVAACAAAGTDYVDLTGEPEFVDLMWAAHHETAVDSGARLVHACGFDSVPHDLGALFTVGHLPDDQAISLRGVVRLKATFSGGTFHSAMHSFSRRGEMREARSARRSAEPRPEGRSSKPTGARPHRDPVLGYWLLPLPTIDPIIVARSGAALPAYGPRFRYSHFAGTRTLPYAVGGALGAGLLGLAAQVRPLRELALRRVPRGEGPDAARRDASWFTVHFVGEAGGQTVRTKVSGGDPGYTETSKMLAQSALCLAFDDLPPTAGQVTTAQAMGQALIDRLRADGITFEVVA
ncbi:saccharopine dehydrogenase family protein [Nocardioides sp. LHG3406-4]|uniref:saccharopine dehydrogenase family protein n=1 Tax=Nocardioides sp. LHG3406-4 TaxID=2804575 RepID=UPI003CF784D5